jgi:hypothetical protein
MNRNIIFISHATPQDNEFSIWLASRLEMLGYKIWLDKNYLLGGEKIWQTIQNIIRNESAKLLLVCSNNIIDVNGNLKDGINKEMLFAEGIAKEHKIEDFIIPLKIDNSSYNAVIGLNILNHIEFSDSWADGLKQLLKKLAKDSVPKENKDSSSLNAFSEWYENEYTSDCFICKKTDIFYSSWWKIKTLPEKVYMHKFPFRSTAYAIRNINSNIPIFQNANCIYSFEKKLKLLTDQLTGETQHTVQEYSVNDIVDGKREEVINGFKKLLSNILEKLFRKMGLKSYYLSGKTAYFVPKYENSKRTVFVYPNTNQKMSKGLMGSFFDINWHYGISFRTITDSFLGYALKAHLIFTKDGINPINDKNKQHSSRRKKGSAFFNKHWMDMQFAFIERLKDKDSKIKIEVNYVNDILEIENCTETFKSEVGYIDPNSKMDIDQIENYRKDFEEDINEAK